MPIDLREALSLHQRGDLKAATRLYEAAIEADPSAHLAHHLLGMVALGRGDLTKAVALLSRAIEIQPALAEYHGGMMEAYSALGQFDHAIESGREAVRLNPGHWPIRSNLGAIYLRVGRYDAAAIQFREAIRLNPNSAESHGNLGKILFESGAIEESLKHCRESVRLQPDSAEAQVRLGNVWQTLGNLAQAEACFLRAIRLRPEHPAAFASLGGVQEQQGNSAQALENFREALRLDPHHAEVLGRLATRLKDRLPEPEEATIKRLLESRQLAAESRISLLYGLAQVCDARGDFDRAADLSIEANELQSKEFHRRGLAYNARARSSDVEQIIAAFRADWFEKIKGWGSSSELPVFVVGMPRSGTSLVEQILASHSKVFGAGELRLASRSFGGLIASVGPVKSLGECLDRIDRRGLERLAEHQLDGLAALDPSADRVVDKMPENTLFLGLIAALFPKARLIYCRRDPRDTALSCWMTHFGQVPWSCEASQIASRIVETDRLMDHWRRVLPIPIHEVVYEELVEDLETHALALIENIGLEWEPGCLEFHRTRREVRTASVDQVRRPIYRGSVGRWKNYANSLAFLFSKLEA